MRFNFTQARSPRLEISNWLSALRPISPPPRPPTVVPLPPCNCVKSWADFVRIYFVRVVAVLTDRLGFESLQRSSCALATDQTSADVGYTLAAVQAHGA